MCRYCSSFFILFLFTFVLFFFFFFFFNDTATTEIYTLSLHDALPILLPPVLSWGRVLNHPRSGSSCSLTGDRKSTRLNSSHLVISYAVFCLKKKKTQSPTTNCTRPTPNSPSVY